MNIAEHKRSEGEEFIADFLDEVGIEFKEQVRLPDLDDDSKSYRDVDFYLPKYNMYLEFYGLWNKISDDKDQEYRKKKQVYKLNQVPCVYLYPENLGIIHFLFDKRLLAEFDKWDMKKEARSYKWWKLRKATFPNMIWGTLFLIWTVGSIITLTPETEIVWVIIIASITAHHGHRIWLAYRDIYVRNRFNLLRILE